jgi:inosose dehydratase
MSLSHPHQEWTRRQAIVSGMTAAAAFAFGRSALARPDEPGGSAGPYAPFQMALQSYSLRGFTRKEGKPDVHRALVVTEQLGLHYWEAYPAHFPITADKHAISVAKTLSKSFGVTVAGYGVVGLGKDADADRKIFDFAKAMGFQYLSADPDPSALDKVDKLVDEYKIPIGIHNHGPGHRYDTIEKISATIKDHSPLVGVCIDTGHFLRSKVDPVVAVEAFGKRIYGVHLKDVKDATTFTILGQGDLRTVDLLKALAAKKYAYNVAIEYEESEQNPTADIRACLIEVKKALAEVRGA